MENNLSEHAADRAPEANAAAFVAQVVPTAMIAGQEYQASVTFRNTGSEEWKEGNGLALHLLGSGDLSALQDKQTWGVDHVPVATEKPVGVGEEATFTFSVVAPVAPGSHTLQVVLTEREQQLGEAAPPVVTQVDVNAAEFVSQLVPREMVCGETYSVAIVMRNTGTTVWSAEKFYRLGHCGAPHTLANEQRWGLPRALLPPLVPIHPGETALFRFEVTAPIQSGNHNFEWRMLQEVVAWFGQPSGNVVITCKPPIEWPRRMEVIFEKVEEMLDHKIERILTSRGYRPAARLSESESSDRPLKIPAEMASRIDAGFATWDNRDSPGCVVAYVDNGELLYERGYGMADVENEIPLSSSSVFPAGSIAKQFIAFAVFMLQEQGKLSLADPLRLHVPEFPVWGSAITLRHLLYHTSGLQDVWELMSVAGWREDKDLPNHKTIEPVIRQEKQQVTPGERFIYSQTGYTLLEIIIQRVTNAPLDHFLQANVFRPLGMVDTGFYHSPLTIVKGRVSSYEGTVGGNYRRTVPDFPAMTASSLFTTLADMARWARNFIEAEVGGGLIEQMETRGTLNNGCRIGYAGGLMTGHKGVKTFEHSGNDQGCRSYYVRFVKARFSIILFANMADFNPVPLGHHVAAIVNRWKQKTS